MSQYPYWVHVANKSDWNAVWSSKDSPSPEEVTISVETVLFPCDISVALWRSGHTMPTLEMKVSFKYAEPENLLVHSKVLLSPHTDKYYWSDEVLAVPPKTNPIKRAVEEAITEVAHTFRNLYPNAHPKAVQYLMDQIRNLSMDIIAGAKTSGLSSEPPAKYKIADFAAELPGVMKVVEGPKGSSIEGERHSLYRSIICLNDIDKWSREKIADWIDELHDKGIINAEFDPWVDEEQPVGYDGDNIKENTDEQD